MKKILFILVLVTVLALPVMASAATLVQIMDGLKNAFWIVFGGLVFVCFVYAGIMFLTAAGNPDKLGKAKSALLWGVVGTGVGLLAWSAEAIIKATFGI